MTGAEAALQKALDALPHLVRRLCCACLLVWALALGSRAEARSPVYGTGFAVSAAANGTMILTALHVVHGRTKLEVGTGTPIKWQAAALIAVDEEHDLALLAIESPLPALPFADWACVTTGQKIFAIGYPAPELLGWNPKITDGIINGEAPDPLGAEMFQFSAAIHNGSSGGPVLSGDGSVVGMVQATMTSKKFRQRFGETPQLLHYATNSAVITNFLLSVGVEIDARAIDPFTMPTASAVFRQTNASIIPIRAR